MEPSSVKNSVLAVIAAVGSFLANALGRVGCGLDRPDLHDGHRIT